MEALGGPLCRGNVAAWPSIAVAALTLSSCSSMCGSTTFDEPDPDPDAERFISRAVFAAGRLWLLTDTGGLSSIAPGSLRRVDAGLPEGALDVCAVEGELAALTCNEPCTEWTLRRWREGRWVAGVTLPSEGDAFEGSSCALGGVTLVSNRRLVDVADGKARSLALSETLQTGVVTSIHTTSEHVFVGINAGEWGGGLRRIDRQTGKVSTIEKNSSGALCGGPLNTECDPVNGIAAEPWRPHCVAVAIGLVHFYPHGRIVEVCDDEARRLYVAPFGASGASLGSERGDEPGQTVAFFGLVRSGDALLAPGVDGLLYRFDGAGAPMTTPLPKLEAMGGIGVSFELPDVVLVLTGVNQRRSISGNVPLVVPR